MEERLILEVSGTRAWLQANLPINVPGIETDNQRERVFVDGAGTYHLHADQFVAGGSAGYNRFGRIGIGVDVHSIVYDLQINNASDPAIYMFDAGLTEYMLIGFSMGSPAVQTGSSILNLSSAVSQISIDSDIAIAANGGSGDVDVIGDLDVTGCVTDGTCEIMTEEDPFAIIGDILSHGDGKVDKYGHEHMDMKYIHEKYPFLVEKKIIKQPRKLTKMETVKDKGGKIKRDIKYEDQEPIVLYGDKLGAKSDLLYVAVKKLQDMIAGLESKIVALEAKP